MRDEGWFVVYTLAGKVAEAGPFATAEAARMAATTLKAVDVVEVGVVEWRSGRPSVSA